MSAKKCCCCGLLSCFPCFSDKKSTLSAQPDSSQATPSALIPTTSQTTASPPTQPASSSTPSSLIPATSQTTASPPTQPASSSTPSSLIPATSQTTASPPTQPPSSSTPSSLIPAASQTTASPPTQPPSSSPLSSLIPAPSQTTASPPTQPPSSSTPSSLILTASQTTASPPTQPASSSTPSSLIPTPSQTTASPPTSPPTQPASSSTPSSLTPTASQTTTSPPTQPASSSTPSSSALIPTASQTTASPPTQPASSSTPSSSRIPKLSDYAEPIIETAMELDKRSVDVDFSDLINYISELLRFFEEKEKEKENKKKKGKIPSKPEATRNYWPGSKNFSTLKEVLAEGIEGIKDVPTGDANIIARHIVKRVGMAHLVTAGFIVVADVLERYDAISANEGACLSLLKEMYKLARYVNELRQRSDLKGSMDDSIKEAITLIVEASLACCTQINTTKFSKFFSTAVNGEELAKFKTRLAETETHMTKDIGLCLYDAIALRRQKSMELQYPEHPKYAVGIEKQLEKVIEMLEMGSNKKAVAVIVHGFGGMGKTTLADAVFARLLNAEIEGYKYCYVRLFDTITSTPNIVQLQKFIIKALKMGEKPKKFTRHEEGQQQIESILAKEAVLIYIDSVFLEQNRNALEELLPKNMGNARKLRLLFTARDKDAVKISGVKPEPHPIEGLLHEEALDVFKKTLDDGSLQQLDTDQLKYLVNICEGVPKLMMVVAGFINAELESKQKAYEAVMEESQKHWKGEIGNEIDRYLFAYDKLEDELKDPFLDICSFFQGWDWKELLDIVGDSKLKRLEKKALVTQDVKSMTARVHDVILEVGLRRTEGNRFRLTTAAEIEKFLKVENLQKIKGIWASDNTDPLHIPASKLDLMSGSLRVLKLGPSTYVQGKCEKQFQELVFFSAITSHLPFYVSKLEGFENLRHLCCNPADLQNLSQMPSELRHVDINLNSHAFQVSSNCIQRLRYLRVLRLSNAQFKSLPQEPGDMGNGLEEVSISGCHYLEELSISGWQYLEKVSISTLKSLIVLRMDYCSGLTQLPKGLGSLTSLQELYLKGCKSLKELPSELENLTSLQKLDLSSCQSLKVLPRSLRKLGSLQELHLYNCNSLQALPNNLEGLSLLRLLDLSWCTNITNLPCGLENLTSLVELELSCCGLSSIPDNIGMLKLNSINLNSTSNLRELPDGFCNFSTLTELDMSNCDCLEKLPERFGKVTSLRKLRLICCPSLKKLPESFCELVNLEHLDLSMCWTLEELCKDFKGLSRLRVLSLEDCDNLKKLPQDFQCLASLEVLDVRNCHKLEKKWMDRMLLMNTLQILRITGSELLEERWEEIQPKRFNLSRSCAVYTKQGLSNEENLLKQFQSEFDSMLTHGEREPLNISGLPLHTLLLVMYDGQQELRPHFPLPLLEESIDDIQTNFKMVYFGNNWDQLPKKVADGIVGHAPANGKAKALFRKLLSLDVDFRGNFADNSFQMIAEIVSGENGDKYLSRWKYFGPHQKEEVESFVVTKCGRYLKLKQLLESHGGSPIAVLRELFAGGEDEISVSFLKNKDGESTEVGVDELQGKTILLDIRPANISYALPLQALVKMYVREKEKFGFEIITVPIMKDNSKLDVSVKFSSEVPWLVLQNPWQLTNATRYFLVEECPQRAYGWDNWYPNRMRIIESDGTIAPYRNPGLLRMVNTWEAAAYPFTAEKEEELIQKEKTQWGAMSDAMFLFQHLERVAEQLRKATGQQKMICICCCHENEITNSMKKVLTKLSGIIYIIYVPIFHEGGGGSLGYFTATIYGWYCLKPSKMSSAEMGRIFSLSLSEYEAMRFWARIRSLKQGLVAKDQIQWEMLRTADDYHYRPSSWMLIMDEDGNLITTKGLAIVKLLSEYPNDRVKEYMQQLLEGTQTNWKKTLRELELNARY